MENRLTYSFVVLRALSAPFFYLLRPVSCIPDTGIFIWTFALSSHMPFLQRNSAFFPISFFHFGCVFLVSVLNCGWHVRALAKPSLRRQVFMAGYVHNGAFQYSEQVGARYCSPSELKYFHFSRKLLYLFSWPFVLACVI